MNTHFFQNNQQQSGAFQTIPSSQTTGISNFNKNVPMNMYQYQHNQVNPDAILGDISFNSNARGSKNDVLSIKETQLSSLQIEMDHLKSILKERVQEQQKSVDDPNSHELLNVTNHELLFTRLNSLLQDKEREIKDIRFKYESMLTALALDPANPMKSYGQLDVEMISQKMVTQLETLTKENQEMSKLLNFEVSKSKNIESVSYTHLDVYKRQVL